MSAESGNGNHGDRTGAHHVAPQTDNGRRLGRSFPDGQAVWTAINALSLPLETNRETLFATAAEHARSTNEHLMIFSGGHVEVIALSGLVRTAQLHRVTTDMSNEYFYITTAEELAETMHQDLVENNLSPHSFFHVLNAATQEVGTAATFATQRRSTARKFRSEIENGLQMGEGMEVLIGLAEAAGLTGEPSDAQTRILQVFHASLAKIRTGLAELDEPST